MAWPQIPSHEESVRKNWEVHMTYIESLVQTVS